MSPEKNELEENTRFSSDESDKEKTPEPQVYVNYVDTSEINRLDNVADDSEAAVNLKTSNESSASEDDTDSPSDVDSNSSDTDEEDHLENKKWSFSFDSEQYSKGIAMQHLPDSTVTILQWLAINFYTFSSHAMSKSAFSSQLNVQKALYTSRSKTVHLPSSYKEARRLLNPFLVKKKFFFACINDCMVFDNDLADRTVQECSSCGSTKTKHFVYLPIGPRIARIFGDENLAKLVQAHGQTKYQHESDVMWDIHDSQAWKNIYSTNGYFKGDNRGLSFAFEADGVSPYHNMSIRYSMTPIMLTLLNLPRQIRNNFGNILLVGIIPGSNRSEASKLDPYVEIMVDELLYLTQCSTVDVYSKAPVEIKIKLLLYILDYPGLSKLFCQHGSGSLSGCHWCHIRGKFCKTLDKVVYLSNRSYLPVKDPLRMDIEHFVDKIPDQSLPPNERQSSEEKDYREAYCRANKKVNRTLIATATGCKSKYALGKLPGHCRLEESLPDAMHTIKDLVSNIMNLLVNKGIDVDKIQLTELNYGRNFHENDTAEQQRVNVFYQETEHETTEENCKSTEEVGCSSSRKKQRRTSKSKTNLNCPYILTSDDIKLADERACNIRVPLGFGLKPSPFIFKNRSALKSHDYKQIASHGILKYCLRGCLSERCRSSLFSLLDSISSICSESIQLDNVDEMEYNLNQSLALMERDFPVSLQNITTHIMHHIVKGIKQFGPIYGTWMFTFERFNSWICRRVFNKRHPEATVMETYTLFEWCNFMISTNRMPSEMKWLWRTSEFSNEGDDYEQEKEVGHEVVLKNNEMNSFHKAINKDQKCLSMNPCKVRQFFSHKVYHKITGRCVAYTAGRQKSVNTRSCFVCFEKVRGNLLPRVLVSSGKFVFGRILFFLQHTGTSLHTTCKRQQTVVACLETFSKTEFDKDSGLWYCPIEKCKMKSFVCVDDLSRPLVTAEENGYTWFLDSGIVP